jgi:hypothetical protein
LGQKQFFLPSTQGVTVFAKYLLSKRVFRENVEMVSINSTIL